MEGKKHHWMQVLFRILRFPRKGPKVSNFQNWQMKTPNGLSRAVIPTILHNWRFYAYIEVHLDHYRHTNMFWKTNAEICVCTHTYKLTNKQKKVPFSVAQKDLRVRELSLCLLLPPCYRVVSLIRQEAACPCQFIGWLKQRMPGRNQPLVATRKQAAALTVEETWKQTRELDSLTYWSQFTHTVSMTRLSVCFQLLIFAFYQSAIPGHTDLCMIPCKLAMGN
jgi:hypothetical protein